MEYTALRDGVCMYIALVWKRNVISVISQPLRNYFAIQLQHEFFTFCYIIYEWTLQLLWMEWMLEKNELFRQQSRSREGIPLDGVSIPVLWCGWQMYVTIAATLPSSPPPPWFIEVEEEIARECRRNRNVSEAHSVMPYNLYLALLRFEKISALYGRV